MRPKNKETEWKGYPGKEGFPDRPRTQFHETRKKLPFMPRQTFCPNWKSEGVWENLSRRAQTEEAGLAAGSSSSLVPDLAAERMTGGEGVVSPERTSPEQILTTPSVR